MKQRTVSINMDKRIKKLRKQSRRSQTELASMIGASQATISLWERGKGEIDIESIMKIGEALGRFVEIRFLTKNPTSEQTKYRNLKNGGIKKKMGRPRKVDGSVNQDINKLDLNEDFGPASNLEIGCLRNPFNEPEEVSLWTRLKRFALK